VIPRLTELEPATAVTRAFLAELKRAGFAGDLADDLATRVGYRRRRVLASVKVLTQAGFLTCSSAHAGKRGVSPRLYQFHSVLPDRVLSAFCWLAFSPEGRQAMLRALSGQTSST